MTSNIELIGAGRLGAGAKTADSSDFPEPYGPAAPIGQHLRVERLVRITSRRMLYLVNNISPLWNKRKCWACGNLYSPNRAQSCTLCGTPLRDRRFLMSIRWDPDLFSGFEGCYQEEMTPLRILQPIAMSYRDRRLMSVYTYNGERLLLDEPTPLPSDYLMIMAHRLGGLLNVYHERGVQLVEFDSSNIMKLPDGSPAWFDLDVKRIVGNRVGLERMPEQPILRDVKNLCSLVAKFCNVENAGLLDVLERGSAGQYQTPDEFCSVLEDGLDRLSDVSESDRAALYTDTGLTRALNEDSFAWRTLADGVMLYVTADGMGGHAGGEWASAKASEVIVEHMVKSVKTSEIEPLKKHLTKAVLLANDAVIEEGKRRGAMIGSTIVAAALAFRKLVVAHAGDSRAYRLRMGELTPITQDHSLVALWVERGKMSREEARVHPKSNVLHSHLGQEDDLEMDVEIHDVKSGDRLLFCSDGLWGEISETELKTILLRFPKPRDCVRQLVRAAYVSGGSDNITVLVVDVP
jgi:protein phosphatase